MRILHLLPHLSKGGAERQFSYLAPALVHMGHQVDVAYLGHGSAKPELDGVMLHQLVEKNNYDPSLLWQLIRLIRCVKPDIIHTWILQMDILGGIAAELWRTPWIFREPSSSMAYLPSWKHRLRVMIGSRANAIVSNSLGGDQYWKTKLPHSRRYIILNGLPIDEIERATVTLPSGLMKSEMPIVLYVGRLIESKNLNTFLEVLALIRQQYNVLGILCGEGPQQTELSDYRHKLGLDENVHFTGYLPANVVWSLMKKASVFVSLSAYEGCPNTVMEAMACGCPLVLSDIPAHREIVDESCARFVYPANIQQTADSIINTLNDKEAVKVRSLAAKQKSQKWSIDEMARNYINVYKDAITFHSSVIDKEHRSLHQAKG